MDAADMEAVYELERMYLHERKRREEAEAMARDAVRDCAEALRVAEDCLAAAQRLEAEKRGAIEAVDTIQTPPAQREVAKWAGVKRETINRWERGGKPPFVIESDGSKWYYSSRLRKSRSMCSIWCALYKLQKANASAARAALGR